MSLTNILLTFVVIVLAGAGVAYFVKRNKNAEVEEEIEKDEKTYTLETMKNYVKKRLDEITKVNLYDIGLSEEELKRRKSKKYALKKALKGCTYGDVNDKRYVKELISDLLSQEYGVNESNISKINSFTYFLSLTSPYVHPFNAFFNSYFLFFLLFSSSSERPISYKFIFVISSSLFFTNSIIFSIVYVLSSTFIVSSTSAFFFFLIL